MYLQNKYTRWYNLIISSAKTRTPEMKMRYSEARRKRVVDRNVNQDLTPDF